MVAGALSGREKSLAGGFIPFAKTKAERVAKNDPRLSLAERYGSVSAYYAAAVEQAAGMVKQRFLLPEDAIRLLQQMMTELEAGKVLER